MSIDYQAAKQDAENFISYAAKVQDDNWLVNLCRAHIDVLSQLDGMKDTDADGVVFCGKCGAKK